MLCSAGAAAGQGTLAGSGVRR